MTLANNIIDNNFVQIKQLLRDGVDVNQIDEYGFTPLIESIIMSNFKITQILLKQGADPNQKDTTGRTPLHWAVDNNLYKTAKVLLENKADPNAYSHNSQTILVYPILRKQNEIKKLLMSFGANMSFAKSYINTKLLGHRFELPGQTHIVTTNNKFILINFEGFFLEFSLNLISHSLERFKWHYQAKTLKNYFTKFEIIIKTLTNAAALTKLQHYTTDISSHQKTINNILSEKLLIIPAVYQGHAITFIRYNDLFVKCDRGANSKLEGSIVIYQITKPEKLTTSFYKEIVFKKQTNEFMHKTINEILGLKKLHVLPIEKQIVGNCSWANVEAVIPSILFILLLENNDNTTALNKAMQLYKQWHIWDQDRALDECIQQFNQNNIIQKASLAAILGAVLLKVSEQYNDLNKSRAKKILTALSNQPYAYIIDSYINIFYTKNHTKIGDTLMQYLSEFRYVD